MQVPHFCIVSTPPACSAQRTFWVPAACCCGRPSRLSELGKGRCYHGNQRSGAVRLLLGEYSVIKNHHNYSAGFTTVLYFLHSSHFSHIIAFTVVRSCQFGIQAFSAVAAIEGAYNHKQQQLGQVDPACSSVCGPKNVSCCSFSEQEVPVLYLFIFCWLRAHIAQ